MTARPFPQEWFTPTPEAHRAAAALAEGFCPYPQCGYPFDEGFFCPVCEITWELTRTGFSGTVTESPGITRSVTVYPLGHGVPVRGLAAAS
jgi:hypothetical protein